MKQIDATKFIKVWKSMNESIKETWAQHWVNNTKWTNFLLGEAKASEKDSLIGESLKNAFSKTLKGYPRYKTEDGKFDLTFTLHPNYKPIQTLGENWERKQNKIEDNIYYPTIYDILIEHENEIYSSWHEIAKLTFSRAFLKVLITYHSIDKSDKSISYENKIQAERDMMIERMNSIIVQSTEFFEDNPQTEYLLIIGRNEKGLLVWSYDIFNHKGEQIVK